MPTDPPPQQKPPLTSAAERALAEAEARRAKRTCRSSEQSKEGGKEISGPSGPEPTRYGDWAINGIASDF
jgi:hypothetical protein